MKGLGQIKREKGWMADGLLWLFCTFDHNNYWYFCIFWFYLLILILGAEIKTSNSKSSKNIRTYKINHTTINDNLEVTVYSVTTSK